jgi:hypothetical protein
MCHDRIMTSEGSLLAYAGGSKKDVTAFATVASNAWMTYARFESSIKVSTKDLPQMEHVYLQFEVMVSTFPMIETRYQTTYVVHYL